MAGYTPIFDSLTRGTLCGRWPDIGLWPIILSLSDKDGVVDVTPLYIAGITGLPEPDVVACMARFCEPDQYSRSQDEGGRRLVLLDDHRHWGWKIVNHGKYREKARKQSHQASATQSGRDAERKRAARKTSGDVRTRPAKSGEVRPSNTNANTDSNKEKERTPDGLNQDAWVLYKQHRKELKVKRLTDRGGGLAMKKLSAFDPDTQMRAVEISIENGWTGLFPEKVDNHAARINGSGRFSETLARLRREAGLNPG